MKNHSLYLYALDPTHIGAGGHRLGRVDNTIQRDAGTNLPKVPGTSISGATRAAAIYGLTGEELEMAQSYARSLLKDPNRKRPHDGAEDPVAKYWGYAEGDEHGSSRIGAFSFRDAEILAYPVPTMAGPRWITTTELLESAGCEDVPSPSDGGKVLLQQERNQPERINLGWMLMDTETGNIPLPTALSGQPGMNFVKKNLAIVDSSLFSSLVNSNLETRTSVAIDFETGTAAETALFTYEATARSTLFKGQVEFDDGRYDQLYDSGMALLKNALSLACGLGLGGMTTRGFGRMQVILEGS